MNKRMLRKWAKNVDAEDWEGGFFAHSPDNIAKRDYEAVRDRWLDFKNECIVNCSKDEKVMFLLFVEHASCPR